MVCDFVPQFLFHQTQNFSTINNLIAYAHREGKKYELVGDDTVDSLVSQELDQTRQQGLPHHTGCLECSTRSPGFSTGKLCNSILDPSSYSPQIRWTLPFVNSLKLNFDRATFKDVGKIGLGVVICNNLGLAIASLLEKISLPHFLDIVETLAVARAISFALAIGCSSFILEGDFELVIKTLNREEDSLSPFDYILALAKAPQMPIVAFLSLLFLDMVILLFITQLNVQDMLKVFRYEWRMFFHAFILYFQLTTFEFFFQRNSMVLFYKKKSLKVVK